VLERQAIKKNEKNYGQSIQSHVFEWSFK